MKKDKECWFRWFCCCYKFCNIILLTPLNTLGVLLFPLLSLFDIVDMILEIAIIVHFFLINEQYKTDFKNSYANLA